METFTQFLQPLIQKNEHSVLPLAGDASSRRYYRVVSNNQSWVLMQWDPFDSPSEFPFLSVQKYFHEHNIRVPEILGYSKEQGLFLLEDLGDLTLERRFWEFQNQENVIPFYEKTLDQLIKIHTLSFEKKAKDSCTAYNIEFSVEKLLWEMNYAKKHLLYGLLKVTLPSTREKSLDHELTQLCEDLYQSPQVVCHRDFHSRNVMISYNDFVVIDFQDARMGPPAYDLVSLFYDSYVELNADTIQHLMKYYQNNFPYYKQLELSSDQWTHFFELQTLQRCFKACGSFASFKMMRDDQRYLHYIKPTLERILSLLSVSNRLPALRSILEETQEKWQNIP